MIWFLKYIGYVALIFVIIVAPTTIWFALCAAKLNKTVGSESQWAADRGNTFRFLQKISADKNDIAKYGLMNKTKITKQQGDFVYNMIERDLKSVFGDNYMDEFDLAKDYTQSYQTPSDCIQWANRLLLAKDGVMLPKDTSSVSGIEIGYETCEWNAALCKIIESYLVSNHPDDRENIRFRKKISYANANDGKYSGNMTLGIYDYKTGKECCDFAKA